MANSYNDSALQFGSQIANINSVNYIAEEFSITLDAAVSDTTDQLGIPNKQYLRRMKKEGSATLQLAALTTPAPPQFAVFTLFPVGANTANTGEASSFIVKKVGQKFSQNDVTKVDIDFVEKLN